MQNEGTCKESRVSVHKCMGTLILAGEWNKEPSFLPSLSDDFTMKFKK